MKSAFEKLAGTLLIEEIYEVVSTAQVSITQGETYRLDVLRDYRSGSMPPYRVACYRREMMALKCMGNVWIEKGEKTYQGEILETPMWINDPIPHPLAGRSTPEEVLQDAVEYLINRHHKN